MHVISHAVILFVDIRGFSAFCEHVNVFQLLEEFLGTCYKHITTVFVGTYIKPLGDGAMIIQECLIPQSHEDVLVLLNDLLQKICQMEIFFRATCDHFALQCGEVANLRLGWGVTRGFVALLTPEAVTGISDYVSTDCNKAAKLCKQARPAGIVIDRVDFPSLPTFPDTTAFQAFSGTQRVFVAQEFTVDGLGMPIAVWASLADDTVSAHPDAHGA